MYENGTLLCDKDYNYEWNAIVERLSSILKGA